jgi:hypothetical protein
MEWVFAATGHQKRFLPTWLVLVFLSDLKQLHYVGQDTFGAAGQHKSAFDLILHQFQQNSGSNMMVKNSLGVDAANKIFPQ